MRSHFHLCPAALRPSALLGFTQLGLALLFTATGCTPAVREEAPLIEQFTASSQAVGAGEIVTLAWKVRASTSVELVDLVGPQKGPLHTTESAEGTFDVAIERDALFLLTASNSRGVTARAVVSVRLATSATAAQLIAFPAETTAGEPVYLSWSAPGASRVSLRAADGTPLDLAGQTETGMILVAPERSSSWTLTADGHSATATVRVLPAIAAFGATPAAAPPGATVRLAWEIRGATKVLLTSSTLGAIFEATDADSASRAGHVDVAIPTGAELGTTLNFLLTAQGAKATEVSARELTVAVANRPAVVSFNVPALAAPAAPVAVAWKTALADSVEIELDGRLVYQSPSAAVAREGQTVLTAPPTTSVVTLIAHSTGGTESRADRTLRIPSPPTITQFEITPATGQAGDPYTVRWTATDAQRVELRTAAGETVYARTGDLNDGSTVLFPNEDTTYTLIVDNGVGGRVSSAPVAATVGSPQHFSPSLLGTLAAGGEVDLAFSTASDGGTVVGVAHAGVDSRSIDGGFVELDTSANTAAIGDDRDDGIATIEPAFHTQLFGQPLSGKVYVSTNGYLSFSEPNRLNYVPVALPTAKLEPYSIAPAWADFDLTNGSVRWRVEGNEAGRALTVQWRGSVSGTNHLVQAKLYETGQIDFAFPTGLPSGARCGIQGATPAWNVVCPTVTAGTGLTFFGPRPSPVTVRPAGPATYAGYVATPSGGLLRLRHVFGSVVARDEVAIVEANVIPAAAVATSGEWVELRNSSPASVDLQGWTLTAGSSSFTFPASTTVPPGGTHVVGQSSDPQANDAVAVQTEWPGLSLSDGVGSIVLSRGATVSTLNYDGAALAAGVSVGQSVGPLRPATATNVPVRCLGSTAYGAQTPTQLGTPGQTAPCGVPYAVASVQSTFHDISQTGTRLFTNVGSVRNLIETVSLAASPVPFFGSNQGSVQVSSNGFLSFATAPLSPTDIQSSGTPSPSEPNALLSVFADALVTSLHPQTGVFVDFIAPDEDPRAPAPHWIIQWNHMTSVAATGIGVDDLSFEVKLFTANGAIEYHFGTMRSGSYTAYASGVSANTWLEAPTGGTALVVNAQSAMPGIVSNSAFRFIPLQ